MSPISRRKLITTGVAVTAGAAGLAAGHAHRPALRTHPARSRRCLRSRRNAHLRRAAPSHHARAGTPVPAQHDLARALRQRNRASERRLQAPPGRRLRRLAAHCRRHGRASHVVFLADFRTLPVSSQITEVACEEGWSYIAEWIGTPLSGVLNEAGVLPQARYIVYYSIQPDWWESVDMGDALHPHTFLTMGMNGGDLPVSFGGPLRLRVAPAWLQEREVHHPHDSHGFA